MFEVTLIRRPKTPRELNNIIVSLMNREFDADDMYCFRTSKLTCESQESISWTLDGENGGSHTTVVIENICKAITIRVPEK